MGELEQNFENTEIHDGGQQQSQVEDALRRWLIGAGAVTSLLLLAGCSRRDASRDSLDWTSPTVHIEQNEPEIDVEIDALCQMVNRKTSEIMYLRNEFGLTYMPDDLALLQDIIVNCTTQQRITEDCISVARPHKVMNRRDLFSSLRSEESSLSIDLSHIGLEQLGIASYIRYELAIISLMSEVGRGEINNEVFNEGNDFSSLLIAELNKCRISSGEMAEDGYSAPEYLNLILNNKIECTNDLRESLLREYEDIVRREVLPVIIRASIENGDDHTDRSTEIINILNGTDLQT